ncbi:MAG: beta-ketoacyl-[acyl-carrier-protein] synthase II [Bdellovibrionales bacterium CG10_big_fil_rev_8_21_14_0_10_45_34]|nr:MAG: beta-ketoacyl-[acyl-carrier-protein] synthase II [Bdellovibrionales bacterium CG10_big_fil_rev_8_21_14_0_10_45_34]
MSASLTRSNGRRRVVVTGIGTISPLGIGSEATWKAALEGRSGVRNITKFDASQFDVRFAGEVDGFLATNYIEHKEVKKMDLFIQYAIAASQMAVEQSGLSEFHQIAEKTGVFVSTGIGGLPGIERQHSILTEKGPGRVSPFFIPMVIGNLASGQIAIRYGLKGPNFCITSACATGAHSIGEAARYIADGKCTVMLAGGAESTISPLALAGFASMRALSTRNDQPQAASRPFDRDRDGFVLGEGACVLVLEDLEHALERGAKILAELKGYAATCDAYHMTAPDGDGGFRAMRGAIEDADLSPSDIGYVNAHGTSTPVGDGMEVTSVKRLLEKHADKVLMSSTKSMTGHLLGAAGALETAFCVWAINDNVVAPTINLDNPSEECDLNLVPHTPVKASIENAMNNSFGFGGTNASLIVSKYR